MEKYTDHLSEHKIRLIALALGYISNQIIHILWPIEATFFLLPKPFHWNSITSHFNSENVVFEILRWNRKFMVSFSGSLMCRYFQAMCWFEASQSNWEDSRVRKNCVNATSFLFIKCTNSNWIPWTVYSFLVVCSFVLCAFKSCVYVSEDGKKIKFRVWNISDLISSKFVKLSSLMKWTFAQQETVKISACNRFRFKRTELVHNRIVYYLKSERTLRAEYETHWPQRPVWFGSANMHFEDLLLIWTRHSSLFTALWITLLSHPSVDNLTLNWNKLL